MHSSYSMGNIVTAPFDYHPNLGPVGHAATYYPGSIAQDVQALNFLDFLSDSAMPEVEDTTGGAAGDADAEKGAWSPVFRASISRFQAAHQLTADSWVGPQTRTALAAAVAFQNANPGALPPPTPAIINVVPGGVPAKPAILPGVQPAAAGAADDTLMYVGIGAGVLALGAAAWYALK